jgi:hypothetical protein
MTGELRPEPRWAPAAALLLVLLVLNVLPHHVTAIPQWTSYIAVAVMLAPMAAVTFGGADIGRWMRIERVVVIILALVYIANTIVELADMIGVISIQPPETRAAALLSSSLTIWITNVMAFSMLYWQIDGGGPAARLAGEAKPDWLFPQAATPDLAQPGWHPKFLDYLFLAFATATAFSPTDALPLTHRAKMLMLLESCISLLTLVVVAARAVNALP